MSVAAAGMMASVVSAYIQPIIPPMPPIDFPYNPKRLLHYTEEATTREASSPRPTAPSRSGWASSRLSWTWTCCWTPSRYLPIPPSVTIEQLKILTLPTALSMATESSAPPIVMFGWGPNIIMDQAVVKSVRVEYQRFLLGVPVRAMVTVKLAAVPLPAPIGPDQPHLRGRSPPGAPERWSRATPWRRSPTRSIAIPTNGGPWPRPTTSTIRCASRWARC